jgi:hypothetical protein
MFSDFYEEYLMGSLVIQICGLLLVIVSSIFTKSFWKAILLAIVIMEVANIIGQGLIANEGPGLFAGFFLLPVLGIIITVVTFYIAKYIKVK